MKPCICARAAVILALSTLLQSRGPTRATNSPMSAGTATAVKMSATRESSLNPSCSATSLSGAPARARAPRATRESATSWGTFRKVMAANPARISNSRTRVSMVSPRLLQFHHLDRFVHLRKLGVGRAVRHVVEEKRHLRTGQHLQDTDDASPSSYGPAADLTFGQDALHVRKGLLGLLREQVIEKGDIRFLEVRRQMVFRDRK